MSESFRMVVPSDAWPSLAAAVADAEEGTQIHIQQGHSETLLAPLIIDKALHIEGPEGGRTTIRSEESVMISPGKAGVVVLKRLELKIVGVPALIIAGGCHLEHCCIDGADVGVEVAAHAGSSVRIQGSVVQKCRLGVSLSGSADADMDGSQIQQCSVGCWVTGLRMEEGWNSQLAAVAKAKFKDNSDSDLTLRGWSVHEKGGEGVRFSAPDGEVVVKGWPADIVNVVAPTEHGAAILLFNGGQVNATLFEEEEEEVNDGGSDDDNLAAESPEALGTKGVQGVAEGAEMDPNTGSFNMDMEDDAQLNTGSFSMEDVAPESKAGSAEPDAPEADAEPKHQLEKGSAPIEPANNVPSPDEVVESPSPPPRALV